LQSNSTALNFIGMVLFVVGFLSGIGLCLAIGIVIGKRLHKQNRELQERVRQTERLANVGTLTGGLAHEIKNPLSTVQLNLQLLKEDLDPKDQSHARIIHRLDTVQREASRLKDILDDFLRFAGKIELQRVPTDLNVLLEELVDFFTPQAQLQRVQLRLKKSDTPLVVPIDVRLVKQAVLNLMINALQAMDDGGELILQAAHNGAAAMIDVIDTGRGISHNDQKRIFDAYYSTKKGGTGLGLAMAKRIAEEHGGSLAVRSEVGKGTDFTVRLPLSIG
jgi:signal transduction histidine kinase